MGKALEKTLINFKLMLALLLAFLNIFPGNALEEGFLREKVWTLEGKGYYYLRACKLLSSERAHEAIYAILEGWKGKSPVTEAYLIKLGERYSIRQLAHLQDFQVADHRHLALGLGLKDFAFLGDKPVILYFRRLRRDRWALVLRIYRVRVGPEEELRVRGFKEKVIYSFSIPEGPIPLPMRLLSLSNGRLALAYYINTRINLTTLDENLNEVEGFQVVPNNPLRRGAGLTLVELGNGEPAVLFKDLISSELLICWKKGCSSLKLKEPFRRSKGGYYEVPQVRDLGRYSGYHLLGAVAGGKLYVLSVNLRKGELSLEKLGEIPLNTLSPHWKKFREKGGSELRFWGGFGSSSKGIRLVFSQATSHLSEHLSDQLFLYFPMRGWSRGFKYSLSFPWNAGMITGSCSLVKPSGDNVIILSEVSEERLYIFEIEP